MPRSTFVTSIHLSKHMSSFVKRRRYIVNKVQAIFNYNYSAFKSSENVCTDFKIVPIYAFSCMVFKMSKEKTHSDIVSKWRIDLRKIWF